MRALSGMTQSMTPTPARMDGPRVIHRKYMAIHICSGADHTRWMLVHRSMRRWASTDIRLVISPTVADRLAELLRRSAYDNNTR